MLVEALSLVAILGRLEKSEKTGLSLVFVIDYRAR
jgi:hypothetical protein